MKIEICFLYKEVCYSRELAVANSQIACKRGDERGRERGKEEKQT